MPDLDTHMVEELRGRDSHFNDLWRKHADLKERVRKGALGQIPTGDDRLAEMKREKLKCKEQMLAIAAAYQSDVDGRDAKV